MIDYRAKKRAEAIIALGGKCSKCESQENLEFDHVNPDDKSFNISGFWYAKKNIENELVKCQLLCKDCHTIKSNREAESRRKSCGSVAEYKRGCRCLLCVTAMRESRQRWNLKYRGRV